MPPFLEEVGACYTGLEVDQAVVSAADSEPGYHAVVALLGYWEAS